MRFTDILFRPFERLIAPLELPVRPVPGSGPAAVVLHFAAMFRPVLMAVGVLSVVSGLIGLATVWALAFVTDGIVGKGATAFVGDHTALLAGFALLLLVIDPLVTFVKRTFMSQVVGIAMPAAMLWQGHKAVERMDIAFFHDMFPGQVASRLGQVSGAVQRELVLAVDMVPRFAIQFVGSAALLGALAWPLAIPVVAWIAANILLAVKAMPIYAKRSAGVAKTSSKSVGAMADIYGNIQTVKLFAAEDSEAGAIRTVIADAINAQHTESRAFIVTDQIVYVLNAMLTVAALGIGIWGLTASVITVGDFVAAIAIVRNLSGSSGAFIGLGQSFSRSIGTIRDALPILSTEPAVVDRPGASALQVVRGGIDFEDVGFFYRQNQPVIEDLSLHIAPGEKLGLVGLSGAGKTTLTNLLLRLYDVTNGTIAIDGHDIAGVTQASLRAQIGVITQDVAMFNRSILDNIRYGKPDASREAVIAAARLAEADAFISGLTDSEGRIGYDAFVGDRGVKLSGGQRQRVAIARVLLKDAPILVLDEATSALDSEAEAAIQDNLERLMAGKTVLAIAHRLSTVRHMDRIAVLEKGRIVELDTPENLIAAGGLFARLWQRQTGGFLPERDEADAMQDAGPVRQRRLREQNG